MTKRTYRVVLGNLFAWRPGGYARASLELLFWIALRAGFQAGNVVLLTRWLGADEYGHFVVFLAVAAFFSQVGSLGLQGVLLRDLAKAPDQLPALLRSCLRAWFVASTLSGLAGGVLGCVALPDHGVPVFLVMLLIFSEVSSNSGVELISRTQQALHNMRAYGAISAGLAIVRIFPLLVCSIFDWRSPLIWMVCYSAAGILYLGAMVFRARKYLSANVFAPTASLIREGVPFAISALSIRLQAEYNKPVLARISFADAGVFNVAQRAVDIAMLPLSALMDVFVPRAYADSGADHRFWRNGLCLLIFAIAGGVVLTLMAPWLPLIVGNSFESVVPLLKYMAWLPFIQVLRNLGNVRLVASGYARRQTGIYLFCAAFSMCTTSFLVERFSTTGAMAAVYLTELALIILLFMATPKKKEVLCD